MADREKTARLFQRAAEQRLTAAEFLLDHGFCLDAIYLAGYGVECGLKALILRRTTRSNWQEVLESLTKVGAKGHDLEYLLRLLKQQMNKKQRHDRETIGQISEHFVNVVSWSTTLRYQVGSVTQKAADVFFRSAREICEWCKRS